MRKWLGFNWLDGERSQLAIFKDEDMVKYLQDHYIKVGKPTGSTTEITQAADNGSFFSNSKLLMRMLDIDEITRMEEHLFELLKKIWTKHNADVHNNNKKRMINARHQRLGSLAILKVQRALQITSGEH